MLSLNRFKTEQRRGVDADDPERGVCGVTGARRGKGLTGGASVTAREGAGAAAGCGASELGRAKACWAGEKEEGKGEKEKRWSGPGWKRTGFRPKQRRGKRKRFKHFSNVFQIQI